MFSSVPSRSVVTQRINRTALHSLFGVTEVSLVQAAQFLEGKMEINKFT